MAGDDHNRGNRPLSSPSAAGILQQASNSQPALDEFGLDLNYIRRFSRTLLEFLSKYYWRIEVSGIENVPCEGRAILVGTHRGFIPWDAIMAVHVILQSTARVPRFLSHLGLFKFPFIRSFVKKFGGVVACQENAERVLQNESLLGVFPEGIHGAFALYRAAYNLKSFGRDSFIKLALHHGAPIVPFVTVGSVEALPIFAGIKSRRWKRYADWPFIPISTFPLVPVPLPSKWHTRFLPAIRLQEKYSPDAAHDSAVVKTMSAQVRANMQQAVDEILQKRPSIFYGSAFGKDRSPEIARDRRHRT